MTKAVPSKLPECFYWIEDPGRRRLFFENVEVLEVRQQRRGWIVQIHLSDPLSDTPMVAVRSPAAGMGWGARWTKQRAPQLAALAAIRRRHAPRLRAVAENHPLPS